MSLSEMTGIVVLNGASLPSAIFLSRVRAETPTMLTPAKVEAAWADALSAAPN